MRFVLSVLALIVFLAGCSRSTSSCIEAKWARTDVTLSELKVTQEDEGFVAHIHWCEEKSGTFLLTIAEEQDAKAVAAVLLRSRLDNLAGKTSNAQVSGVFQVGPAETGQTNRLTLKRLDALALERDAPPR